MNDLKQYGRIVRAAGLTPEQVLAALQLHERALAGEPVAKVHKNGTKTRVTVVQADELGPEPLCIKQFIRHPALLLAPGRIRHRPAFHSWAVTDELLARGVRTPLPLALVTGGRSSYLLMRRARSETDLRGYVRRCWEGNSRADRLRIISACADFVADCWQRGVFQQDMKSTNVFIIQEAPGQWTFELIDTAAIRFGHPGRNEMICNLVQLNCSTPRMFSRTDRVRFFRAVAARVPELAEDALREIVQLSLARGGKWLR